MRITIEVDGDGVVVARPEEKVRAPLEAIDAGPAAALPITSLRPVRVRPGAEDSETPGATDAGPPPAWLTVDRA